MTHGSTNRRSKHYASGNHSLPPKLWSRTITMRGLIVRTSNEAVFRATQPLVYHGGTQGCVSPQICFLAEFPNFKYAHTFLKPTKIAKS